MEKELKEGKSKKSPKDENNEIKKEVIENNDEEKKECIEIADSNIEIKDEINTSNSEVKVEKQGKAKKIIIIIILLLCIFIFIWWWFNRKFNFTFKYNNGLENYTVKVKFLNKVNDEDVKRDITLANHTFIDYFETYYLDGKSIEKIKENPEFESSICKKDFKLNEDKNKCIAINPYDFKKKRITKDTTVEAFWSSIIFNIDPIVKEIYVGEGFNISVTLSGTSDTKINWSSENDEIASVDDSGHVIGKKEGKTTIVVESNGIKKTCDVTVITKSQPKQEEKTTPKSVEQPVKKDDGTIKLSSNNQCLIGSDSLSIMANVSNALDDTINWNSLKCFNINKISSNQISLSRLGNCDSLEELNPTITASLNNGASDSLNINYESRLGITVYDGNKEIQKNSEGVYKGNNIRVVANQSAKFTAVNPWNANQSRIFNVTDNIVHLDGQCDATVVVKTNCGQSITLNVEAEIN